MFIGTLLAALPNPALIPSQSISPDCNFVTGDIHFGCIPVYVGYLVQLVFGLVGGFALIELIKGGYQVMFSGLTDKEAGKNRIKHALIGFVVAVLAFVIVDLILAVITT